MSVPPTSNEAAPKEPAWGGQEPNRERGRTRARHATVLAILGFVMMSTSCLPLIVAFGWARERLALDPEVPDHHRPLFWLCVGVWVLTWLVPFVLAHRLHDRRYADTARDPRGF